MHISLLSITVEDLKLLQSMHFSLLSMVVNDPKLQQSMHQVVEMFVQWGKCTARMLMLTTPL